MRELDELKGIAMNGQGIGIALKRYAKRTRCIKDIPIGMSLYFVYSLYLYC